MPNTDKHELLLKCLHRFEDPVWLNGAFDVLKSGLEALNIDGDHPALAMTVNKNEELNVNIGQRWIWKADFDFGINLILPLGTDAEALGADVIMNPFTHAGQPDAEWAGFPYEPEKRLPAALMQAWQEAMETELRRCKKSGFRKYHSPEFWELVMLSDVRERVFAEAFGEVSNLKGGK